MNPMNHLEINLNNKSDSHNIAIVINTIAIYLVYSMKGFDFFIIKLDQ